MNCNGRSRSCIHRFFALTCHTVFCVITLVNDATSGHGWQTISCLASDELKKLRDRIIQQMDFNITAKQTVAALGATRRTSEKRMYWWPLWAYATRDGERCLKEPNYPAFPFFSFSPIFPHPPLPFPSSPPILCPFFPLPSLFSYRSFFPFCPHFLSWSSLPLPSRA